MKRLLFAVVGSVLLGSTLAAHPWPIGLLYVSSFESHKFKVGKPLNGQGGWVGLASVDAAQIVHGRRTARLGRRAVGCWAGDLDVVVPGLLDGAWEQPIDFDAVTKPAIVRVQAAVRLDGPDTGTGPGADLVSANLMARNGSNRSAFFYLSSNGTVYANSNSETAGQFRYKFETPIRRGCYNRLAIILNYATHMATFEVNGSSIGSLPFGGSGEKFQSVLLEMAAWDDPSFDPNPYTAYWDNVLVLARRAR